MESILLLVEMVALGAKLVDPAGFNLHVIEGKDTTDTTCAWPQEMFGVQTCQTGWIG